MSETEADVTAVCVPLLDFALSLGTVYQLWGLSICHGRHYLFHIISNVLCPCITP
jgi:hypothetical protein